MHSLSDSSVNIALRAWASNQDYWNIYWEQTRNLKAKIEEAGLHIPFPQRDIHLIGPDGKPAVPVPGQTPQPDALKGAGDNAAPV